MKVLFVSSGNSKVGITPLIKNQGEALLQAGVELHYYAVKGKGISGYLKNIPRLREKIKELRPDIIHAHYSLTAFMASLAGCQPLVVSLMGSDVKASKRYKWLIRCFAWLFRWRAIIVKSKDMFSDLGLAGVQIIPNGVNLERFKPMSQSVCREQLGWESLKKHIVFPADPLRPEKDFDLASAAVALLDEQIEIHYFQNVPNEHTPYWYNAAHVVLMTSKWEGSPNAIKEALACGCPIVSTDVGDVAERTEGVDGCFVAKSRDPKEIAELLQKALTFPSRTTGHQHIMDMELDNQTIASKLFAIYQQFSTNC